MSHNARCSCTLLANHLPPCCTLHIPWSEGNAGMSIHACRRAQQSVHAQTQIDEDQFAIDVTCDVAVGIFKRLLKSRTLSW